MTTVVENVQYSTQYTIVLVVSRSSNLSIQKSPFTRIRERITMLGLAQLNCPAMSLDYKRGSYKFHFGASVEIPPICCRSHNFINVGEERREEWSGQVVLLCCAGVVLSI